MIDKIVKKFGNNILRRSATNLVDGTRYMEYFMSKEPIKTAIEIGTFRGVNSSFMSQYCKELYTIDLKIGQLEKADKKSQPWIDTPYRHDVWNYLGIDNIIFIPIKDNKDKINILNGIDFDFAFIDGDHSYQGVEYDFNLVKKCGRVLFHDYDKAPGKDCPVRDFINTIKDGNIETSKDYAYWTSDGKEI